MNKSRFSDAQIVNILSSITDSATVREVCLSHEVSEYTFYTWKRMYAGMELDVKRIYRYIERYNTIGPHSALGGKTPNKIHSVAPAEGMLKAS